MEYVWERFMASLTRAVGRGADKPLKREVLLVQQLLVVL
jgi:hypothetical protein